METWEILMLPQDGNTHTLAQNLLVTCMKCLYLVGGTPYHTTHLTKSYPSNANYFPSCLQKSIHTYALACCKKQQKVLWTRLV